MRLLYTIQLYWGPTISSGGRRQINETKVTFDSIYILKYIFFTEQVFSGI